MTTLDKNKNSLGIGVDVDRIDRFRKLDLEKNKIFLNRIYLKEEIAYCYRYKDFGAHLAARFVAKEAIIKALSNFGLKAGYTDIEVVNSHNGTPKIRLKGHKFSSFEAKISISHSKDCSVAFGLVTITK